MRLRNTHVKETVGILFSKGSQPRTIGHGCGHSHQIGILLPQLTDLPGKYIRIRWILLLRQRLARVHVKRTYPVEVGRILLSRPVAFTFFCDHMDQDSVVQLLCFP